MHILSATTISTTSTASSTTKPTSTRQAATSSNDEGRRKIKNVGGEGVVSSRAGGDSHETITIALWVVVAALFLALVIVGGVMAAKGRRAAQLKRNYSRSAFMVCQR
jgi:hypothetical protein